jgi:hypothetical protein
MTGVFLGAGFSKWAGNLPLVNQLFDFNISNIRFNDEAWLSKLIECKKKWDLLDVSNKNEEAFISYIITQKGKNLNKYLLKYISRRLSEPFLVKIYGGSMQTLMIDDAATKNHSCIEKAKRFFEYIDTKNIYGIITTNYDLMIEYALGTPNFKYSPNKCELLGMGRNRAFPWQNTPVITNGNIKLSKIHGSISYDGSFYWTTGKCGLNGNAVILPPSPEKSRDKRFINEWNDAEDILMNIDKLVIFGFNFNEYDHAVLELLKTNSKNIKEIHIYDLESKINQAKKIWTVGKITELKPLDLKY